MLLLTLRRLFGAVFCKYEVCEVKYANDIFLLGKFALYGIFEKKKLKKL